MAKPASCVAPFHSENGHPTSLVLDAMLARRSVHPKRLIEPGPDSAALQQMADAAATAADHGGLRPWRLLAITGDSRSALGEIFADIKKQREPHISLIELERERNRARAVPAILVVISRVVKDHPVVPILEQYACVGAAIQNILLCADDLGFGAKMVSGKKVKDPQLAHTFDLALDETVFGFVCLGTTHPDAPIKPRAAVPNLITYWSEDESSSGVGQIL